MPTTDEIKPAVALEIMSNLTAELDRIEQRPAPTPEEIEQANARREALSAKLYRDQCRNDARARWEAHWPESLRSSDWDHPDLAPFLPCIQRVTRYQLNAKGIIASGPTGRGKTRSMAELTRRLGIDEGHDVRYWYASDWFTSLQDCIRYGRDEARGWVEAVAHRPVVFIDDYGQEALSITREDWAQAWFFRFLDIRANERLPLFMTTNLTAHALRTSQLGSIRGDPLMRRLLDVCEPVPFETESERQKRVSKPITR